MNTDRELLELAAKAVNFDTGHSWNALRLEMDPPVTAMVVHDASGNLVSTGWNPLENDGDALRLAVRLDLHVQCDFKEDEAKVYVYGGWVGNEIEEEPGELDKFGATRRAIVRAAAEIGRAMS